MSDPGEQDDRGHDYDPFYLGEVRVVQADKSCFMAYGEHLPGGLQIYRGQVSLCSLLESDAGAGARGRLTVTRWWALSRGLTEAPRRGKWRKPERSPLDEVDGRESASKKPRRPPSSGPMTPPLPSGFKRR